MISWPYCLRALLLLSVWLILEGKSPIAHADGSGSATSTWAPTGA